jgi:single-stranded-DNA-specific exonuclease
VVGLVASRVKDRVRRPVIAFARATDAASGGASLRGSARSVAGVHVRDVLDAIATREPDLIAKFGGHAMAAGLTLEERWLDRFSRAFDAECAAWLQGAGEDAIETDGELPASDIALATAQLLREAGPWGQGFPEPCFDGVFAVKSSRVVGDRHVKLWVQHPDDGASFDAIAFNYFDGEQRGKAPAGNVHIVYRLDINEYRGERRLQLLVDHLRMLN